MAVADLASGTFSQENAGIGLPTSLALSDDGSTLAVGGPEARIAQLDTQTGRPHGEPIEGLSRGITVLSYSPNNETLAVGDEGSVWLVDLATGSIREKLVDGDMGWSLAWTEDGSRLAIGLGSGDVVVWDVASNSEDYRLDIEDGDVAVTSVEWSSDGTMLATGSASGAAQLWSTDNWQPVGRELRAHGSYVIDTRFSEDGKWLATFGGDGAAALWDIEMGRQLGTSLVGSMNEWGGIWLSPNADRLVTYQTDGTIWEWPLDDAALLERVCAVAGRDLTADEWATYAPGLEVSPVCPDPAE